MILSLDILNLECILLHFILQGSYTLKVLKKIHKNSAVNFLVVNFNFSMLIFSFRFFLIQLNIHSDNLIVMIHFLKGGARIYQKLVLQFTEMLFQESLTWEIYKNKASPSKKVLKRLLNIWMSQYYLSSYSNVTCFKYMKCFN